jgi:fibro-slime domain-containing protein
MNRPLATTKLSTMGVLALAGALMVPGTALAQGDPYSLLPTSIELTGVCRDFRARNVAGGHPDFELVPPQGLAHYIRIAANDIGFDGKPEFTSTGRRVISESRDSQGRNIIGPKTYLAARAGDVTGSIVSSSGQVVTSDQYFHQWFNDVPGVNMSRAIPITLQRQAGTNRYVYDDELDTRFAPGEGFFIVNNHLYGNEGNGGAQGGGKNYDFTYEVVTTFTFQRNTGQIFTFSGDDDMWVFIDGKLVIDIGGIHNEISQTIDLDRCNWLVDGNNYEMKIFFAERNKTESHFRIETTLANIRSVAPPPTAALAD